MSESLNRSWRERALRVMPFGSSTCSKAPTYEPDEPAVIVRGKGCRVWDADGREFIDYRNSLGPITLGYGFPAVDDAIRAQLDAGIIFGHPHPLECEVAEMLCEVLPCAEQVRFLKTGGEAMAACIRIARAYTGRDHVIQIGYNGWLNSLASGGRVLPGQTVAAAPPGVPACLSQLHHGAGWNNETQVRGLFDQWPGQIAAVVVAAGYPDMDAGRTFLPFLRDITRRHGALLVHDEIVTGFRVAIGGIQEHFKVTPDLAVFAKGIANGMPLAAYAGRRDVMQTCRTGGVVVSSTYGGEALSLAAAKAAITTYRTENVIGHLWQQGERLWSRFGEVCRNHRFPLEIKGVWPCAALTFTLQAPKNASERFYRAAYRNGVSLYGVSYVNFSHRPADIDETLDRLDRAVGEAARQL